MHNFVNVPKISELYTLSTYLAFELYLCEVAEDHVNVTQVKEEGRASQQQEQPVQRPCGWREHDNFKALKTPLAIESREGEMDGQQGVAKS